MKLRFLKPFIKCNYDLNYSSNQEYCSLAPVACMCNIITEKKQTGRQGGWLRICEDYSQNKQTKQLINKYSSLDNFTFIHLENINTFAHTH